MHNIVLLQYFRPGKSQIPLPQFLQIVLHKLLHHLMNMLN
jgi:hypothetical protein